MNHFKYLLLFFIVIQSVNAYGQGQLAIKVKAAKIGYYDFYNQFTGVGKCEFINSKDYYAKVAGSVDTVLVKQGQAISKDELVIAIDQEVAHSMLSEARVAYELAKANYNRDISLFRKKVISEEALNKSKLGLEQDRLGLVKAEKQFADMVIKAPFDGCIGVVRAKEKDEVKVGDYLFSMVAKGEKIIFVEVPENLLGKITPDSIIKAIDADKMLISGQILAVADYVSANGTVTLKALFPASAKLNHGSFIEISLLYGRHKGLAIPEKAVLKNDKGNFIYKISQDGTVKQVYVSLGTRTGEMIELIENGLQENDMIVTEGLTKIQNDSLVELINE